MKDMICSTPQPLLFGSLFCVFGHDKHEGTHSESIDLFLSAVGADDAFACFACRVLFQTRFVPRSSFFFVASEVRCCFFRLFTPVWGKVEVGY